MLAALADHLLLALLALAIEAVAGYPDNLFRRIGHPATWFGRLIGVLDGLLNRDEWPKDKRRAAGFVTVATLLFISVVIGETLQSILLQFPFGMVALAVISSTLIAQRSLYDHVADVANALERSLAEGRSSVAKIVGRDVSSLDEAGVSRAAIESLAENFSDGVVAPTLFLALFGLPGALVYKAVNTADSMIGHRTPRYESFGFAAARLDDLFNLPAARISAGLIALAAAINSTSASISAFKTSMQDARKHASPNAGWPESAMAGALNLRLGGPRSYRNREVKAAWLGNGRIGAGPSDIRKALQIYRSALVLLWLVIMLAGFAVRF